MSGPVTRAGIQRTNRLPSRRGLVAALALGAVAVAAPASHAENATGTCALIMDPNNAPVTDPRVDHIVVEGVSVTVLLPPHYSVTQRRYPVLYLFHGAFGDQDSFTTQTDLIAYTATMSDRDQAVIVMPNGGHLPAASDWVDGTQHQESYFVRTLVPWIDGHYRTFGDREHRAAAGFSGGGLDSMLYSSRHPELFVAAGSFSGLVDQLTANGVAVVNIFSGADDALCGATTDPNGIWGDPAIHPMGWESHDPTNLAANLRGVALFIASGNGTPCADDPQPVDPMAVWAESSVYEMGHNFDAALTAAHVRHVTDFYGCGIHTYSYVSRDLRRWWPFMLEAFGNEERNEFDFLTGDASASAWGWAFAADPRRAQEFLNVRDASREGFRVTGSGLESVTTAALFRPGQQVRITGASDRVEVVRADALGRLALTVDLGAAHSLEQDTAEERAAAAANPAYFATRSVQFSRDDDRDGRDSHDHGGHED